MKKKDKIAKDLKDVLAEDVVRAKNTKRMANNLSKQNFKLDINPDMHNVKDFYWGMKFEKLDITPKQAAKQCGINPGYIDDWFTIPRIEEWFFEAPFKIRDQLKANSLLAMRRCREIMMGDDAKADNMIKYVIDQATGKAKEKSAIGSDEDEDQMQDDIKRLEEIEAKINKLKEESDENDG